MRRLEILLQRYFLLVPRCVGLARKVDLPDECFDVDARLRDLLFLILRSQPGMVDLLGEAGDGRTLVAQLLLLAGDRVAKLALDDADAARAHRRDLGAQRLADRGQVRTGQRELVGARPQRGFDLVARLVRRARGVDMALELGDTLPRHVHFRGALPGGRLACLQLLREPRRHCHRQGGTRGDDKRGDGGLRIHSGGQVGEFRVAAIERCVEAGREALARRPFRRLVVLSLQLRLDEVGRGFLLRSRGLERKRRIVANARQGSRDIREKRIVRHHCAGHPARISLGVDEMRVPQRERFFRRELISARKRGGHFHRPAHHQDAGGGETGCVEHAAPERQQPAQARILQHGKFGIAEFARDDARGVLAHPLDERQRHPAGGQWRHAVPARAEA